MSSLAFEPLAIPVREDEHGALRVGKTRVLLELVIRAFEQGATPEAIVQSYETLELADVYAVISHYLAQPKPIAAYLRRRETEAATTRQAIEAFQGPQPNLRQRLMARTRATE